MGVETEQIVLYGWRVPYDTIDDWHWEKREQYYHDERETGETVLVFDSMGGQYALVGLLEYYDDKITPVQKLDGPSIEAEREMYRAVYQEMELEPDGTPEYFVLTHHR